MEKRSSLLVTTSGTTPLDELTRSIYPPQVIRFLNTPIGGIVNVWSLAHLGAGVLAMLLGFTAPSWLIAHSLFEVAEVWLAGLTLAEVDRTEWADILLDTGFAMLPLREGLSWKL